MITYWLTAECTPNFLDRKFEVGRPNRFWTTDITYVWTLEGWLYPSRGACDLYSRQVVGWAMDKRMKRQLTLDALSMAYWRRKSLPGLLHHLHRGSQYTCHDCRKRLIQYGMVASMSRKATGTMPQPDSDNGSGQPSIPNSRPLWNWERNSSGSDTSS